MWNVVHRLARNSALLLTSTLITRGASAILFIVAARQLAPESVGAYSLAITYLVIMTGVASWGLDQLLIRDVAQSPTETTYYVMNFGVLRLGLAVVVYMGLRIGLYWFHPYVPATIQVILIIGLSVIPDSVNDICQATFIAREKVIYSSSVSSILSLVRIGLGIAILLLRPDLLLLAWIFPLTSLISMFASIGLIVAVDSKLALRLNLRWLAQIFVIGLPLAVINILLVLEVQASIVLLSLLVSETAVGIYGAANAIFTALAMLPYAWQASIFPLMSRLYARADGTFEWLYEKLYLYLAIGAVPLVLTVSVFADAVIRALYGIRFEDSIPVLRILIITLFFSFMNIPNSRLMLILNRQDVLAVFLILGVIVNLSISWLLIPYHGAFAIAVARVCSSGLFFLANYLFIYCQIRRIKLWQLVWRTLVSGLGALGLAVMLGQSMPIWRMMVMLLGYVILLWLFKAVPREDMNLIWRRGKSV